MPFTDMSTGKGHPRSNDDVIECIRFWPITLDRIEIEAWKRHHSVLLEHEHIMISNMTYLGHLVTMT